MNSSNTSKDSLSPVVLQTKNPNQQLESLTGIVDFSAYFRKMTPLQYIKPIYSKSITRQLKTGEVIFDKSWTLFEAKPNLRSHSNPPILLLDTQGLITPGRNAYPLKLYSPTDLLPFTELWESMPTVVKKRVTKLLDYYPINSINFDPSTLIDNKILYEPILRLADTALLDKIDWNSFVENELLSFQSEKDPRLKTVFKATILRGVDMLYCPHALLCTGPATGKSYIYDIAGIRRDKVTPVSLIGTRTENRYSEGLVQDQTLPVCIEQLESQSAHEIFRFMLTFMEKGKASASTAFGSLEVEGQCTFVVTANPTGYDTDKIASFRSLIDSLGSNHNALGRRIGLLVYGGDGVYQRVKSLQSLDETAWNSRFEFFRSIEEYAYPLIQRLFKDATVRTWFETPITNYESNVNNLASQIEDRSIKEFLRTHGYGAYRHIRGGALNCAIIDMLLEFVNLRQNNAGISKEIVEQLLVKADGYVGQLVNINLESIANISKTLETEWQFQMMIYEKFPNYLKDIIATLKAYKEQNVEQLGEEVPFAKLEGYFNQDNNRYWSNVECNLANSNIETHNLLLSKYFGFKVVKKADNVWSVVFTDTNKTICIPETAKS
ncbi:MAG: hypothetical protein NWE96_04305 [Candidatus Bathyarchaeota archaeon]|nr:hypothetical protein [Candidatus Bathyarchaeota archaeon]